MMRRMSNSNMPAQNPPRPYSVSQLNREVRLLLESGLPVIWLSGEVSNFSRPASGHWYFTLKDSKAQVRCAMFRNRNQLVAKMPVNGEQILIRARISVYEARGEYQLLAESMEDAGAGLLRQQFDALKQKLDSEGLFDATHKQALPSYPKRIGLVTSPTGAAVRDIIQVLGRRYPAAEVIIYPSSVQGDAAPQELMEAINQAVIRNEVDVLIVGRGGGSAEDLWAFNDEALAYVLHACPIPVVSAVGHEVDFTIADFVADHRAPTPSAAAELVSPDTLALQQRCQQLAKRLQRAWQLQLQQKQQQLKQQQQRLLAQHPNRRLQEDSQRVDDAERRLVREITSQLERKHQQLNGLQQRLAAQSPVQQLPRYRTQLEQQHNRLLRGITLLRERKRQQFTQLARSLHSVGPLATLDRGYAIATRDSDEQLLRSSEQVNRGEAITLRLAEGALHCRVEQTANADQ